MFAMYVCFYVLGSTADGYLSPVLANIAKHLKFSESLAGVTLLAFGNGAPDVFSALSASSDVDSLNHEGGGEGFYLAAASSLGSGLFVSSIVSSAIALLASPSLQ
jgi:solute carrier family 24 (sodium/potassium/calcium exchanger), member 6